MTEREGVAVDPDECPQKGGPRCRCGKCAVCGWPKHTSAHGPYWKDGVLIQKPYLHEFKKQTENPE